MKYFLFDIGNVLANYDFQMLLEAYANGGEVLPLTERDLDIYHQVERGEVSDEQYVVYLNETKGLAWTVDEMTALWCRMFSINKMGQSLFEQATMAGTSVYTLSNISKFHMDAIDRNWSGFFDDATGLFLSYQIGVRKPHPEIYRHVLDDLDAKGEQCFFIDDLPENIEAARAAGIHAHQFIPENYAAIREAAMEFFDWA